MTVFKSVVTTTERTFVICFGQWLRAVIDVWKGPAAGENVSVRGQTAIGQEVVKRAPDEIREGSVLAHGNQYGNNLGRRPSQMIPNNPKSMLL
jgi:hypothetical protein